MGSWWQQSGLREKLTNELIEKTRSLGRKATFMDVKNDATMVPPNDYAFYYGSFEEAAKVAWAAVKVEEEKKRKEMKEKMLENQGTEVKETKEVKEAEPTAKPEDAKKTSEAETNSIVEAAKTVLRIQEDLGFKDRLPTQKEINQYAQTYGTLYYTSIAKHLGLKGGWPEAIAKALDIKISDVIQYAGPLEPEPAPKGEIKDNAQGRVNLSDKTQLARAVTEGAPAPTPVKPAETAPVEPAQILVAPVPPPTEVPTSVASALAKIFGVSAVDLVSIDLTITEPNGKYSLKMQKIE